jgi:hypothetical protein
VLALDRLQKSRVGTSQGGRRKSGPRCRESRSSFFIIQWASQWEQGGPREGD